MPSITYLHADGMSETIEVPEGTTVMRAAITNGVDGIVGECGGQAMCATCHVYVQDAPDLPPLSEDEDEMLEAASSPRRPDSRLGCQLHAGTDFESLVVRLPERQ